MFHKAHSARRLVILLGVVLLLSLWLFSPRVLERRVCAAKLGSICGTTHKPGALLPSYYESVNAGAFPSNMSSFASVWMANAAWGDKQKQEAHICESFICPSTGTTPGAVTNIDQWMDYVFIYWPNGRNRTPKDYPLMYDRRLSNHGSGINVITVSGRVFWDRRAKWLRRFAEEHPDLDIPMPVDMK